MKPTAFPLRATALALAAALVLTACGESRDPQKMMASAQQYLDNNDMPAAIIQLKNVLQEEPNSAQARFLLGRTLLLSGDMVGGETELRKARELGYAADDLVPLLARSRLAQGEFRKVTDEFAQTRLAAPAAQADLHALLAIAWRYQNNPAAYKASLQEALKLQPDHAMALVEQARIKASEGDADGAMAVLDGVLAKNNADADAHKLRGDILLAVKREPDQALAAYRASVTAKPAFQEGQAAVVRTLLVQGKLDVAEQEAGKLIAGLPQTHYLKAQLAVQKGNLVAAQEQAQQLLKLTPDVPAALEMAGSIEYQQGNLALAQALLVRAVQAAPELRIARHSLVMTHLRAGQVDRALATLPPGLDVSSNDSDMLSLAGQVYMVKGDVALAQRYFARAASLDPANAGKRTSLALTQLRAGRGEQALGELERIAASDTGTVADMALINAHLQRKEVDKALAAIGALEKKRPNDPMVSHLRGRALLVRDDRAGARAAFERAHSVDPKYFAATAALVNLDMAEKKPQDARKRLETLIASQPNNTAALLALAQVRERQGDSPQTVLEVLRKASDMAPGDKEPRLALVDYHMRRNDPKAALSEAQAAVVAQPNVPDLVDALGRAHTAAGEYNQAMNTFNQLSSLLPQSPLPQVRIATVHVATRNTSAGIAALRKALQIQPNHWLSQRNLTDLLLQTNQAPQAMSLAKSVQKEQPKDVAGYLLEGDVHATGKRWGEAVQAYQTGMKQGGSPELVVKLHSALTESGKGADAQQVGANWMKEHPGDVSVALYMGDRALAAKRLPDAQRLYQQVIEQDPDNAAALNNLAWVSGELGLDDAVALAERANRAAPNQPAFIDTLAMLLSDKKEHARALELQKRAVQLQPNTPYFKLNLARIHLKAGDKGAAKTLLDELAALGDRSGLQADVEALKKEI